MELSREWRRSPEAESNGGGGARITREKTFVNLL
jgi:hypothetical protein